MSATNSYEDAQRTIVAEWRPRYYELALQAGMPDDVLYAIKSSDEWVLQLYRHGGKYAMGEDAIRILIFVWKGIDVQVPDKPLRMRDYEYPHNLQYRRYWESWKIARLGIDVLKVDNQGKYLLCVDNDTARAITAPVTMSEVEVNDLARKWVGEWIPKSLESFATAAGEKFLKGELKSLMDEIHAIEVNVQSDGLVDATLTRCVSLPLIPKGLGGYPKSAIKTLTEDPRLAHVAKFLGISKRPKTRKRIKDKGSEIH
jgi:hypothetical protein